MEIVINPQFEAYRNIIESFTRQDVTFRKTFRQHRNLVGVCQMGPYEVVVKRYKRPTLANCVIYTWFRKNKAQRAYENALCLLDKGITTPTPVAYMVLKRLGFVHTCYFISLYLPWPPLSEADAATNGEANDALWREYMGFARQMHEKGLLLRDNNQDNTLVSTSDTIRFALVDINRLQHSVHPRWPHIVTFFYQLGLPWERLSALLPYYRPMSTLRLQRFAHDYRLMSRWRRWKHEVKHWLKRLK